MPEYYRSTFTFEGKRHYVKGKTQKEADQKAALKKAELEAGVVAASRMTVADWWTEYLDVYHTQASAYTRELYQGIYKNSIAPYIGPRPLKSVRSADLQRIMNNLSTKSESYAKKAKFLLVGLFRTAVDNDLIPKSPANSLQLPVTAPPNERRALTKRERLLFLNAAEQLGQPGLFFLIMYYEGLRPSEVCRIRHEDFEGEGDQRVLHVRGSKTKASTRTLPVSALLDIPEGSGPLFISGSGRPPSKTVLANWWRKVTRKMEEISGTPTAKDLTAYCLRHDFCTRCQEGGLDIDITRRMMGHSSIEVTSRSYTHPSDAAIETARKVINRGSTVPQGVTQDR